VRRWFGDHPGRADAVLAVVLLALGLLGIMRHLMPTFAGARRHR